MGHGKNPQMETCRGSDNLRNRGRLVLLVRGWGGKEFYMKMVKKIDNGVGQQFHLQLKDLQENLKLGGYPSLKQKFGKMGKLEAVKLHRVV